MDYSEWNNIDAYGYSHEDAERIGKQDIEMCQPWHDLWVNNIDENMKIITNDADWIRSEYGKYEGPVIVCGAGPSLRQNMKWLIEQHENGIPIICVDRALATLKEKQIRPMMVVSLDAQSKVAGFYELFDSLDVAALCISCHPDVYHRVRWGKKVYWFGVMNPFSSFWDLAQKRYGQHISQVRVGCVVTFSAVDIAIWLGFKTIVTVGNELGFFSKKALAEYLGYNEKDIADPVWGRSDFYTITAFRYAAAAFDKLPSYHPDINFIDVSGGLVSTWDNKPMITHSGFDLRTMTTLRERKLVAALK